MPGLPRAGGAAPVADHEPRSAGARVIEEPRAIAAGAATAGPGATAAADRAALIAVAAWTAVMAAVTLVAHGTPLYFVETDLLGEYLPAARELGRGVITGAHYTFKGPGYPALLALLGAAGIKDGFLAARLLSVAAAGVSAWLGYRLIARLSRPRLALLALGVMLTAPALVRYAIEAGTDTPALALMLGATLLALRARTRRGLAAAGLVAACAVLTRGNALFLAPAALLALLARNHRVRAVAAYAAGFAIPLATWSLLCARAGAIVHDHNYLNVAAELYARDLPWDEFESAIGSRFSSLAQVLAYDPWHAAGRIAGNLITHRARDLRELIPIWLGLAALPGLVLLARQRTWRLALVHAGLCALALAAVFYNARFALYLLPFYAAAAATALAQGQARVAARSRRLEIAGRAAIAASIAASAAAAAITIAGPLATAPREVRAAGAMLARLGEPGDRVMARKPHVAWFAGMTQVPLPGDTPLLGLLERARSERARWLFFSPVERATRPEYAVLADSGVRLPGLEPVQWQGSPGHYFALYRFTGETPDSAAFAIALASAVDRYAARHTQDPDACLFAALQMIGLGRGDRALAVLDDLRRRGVTDARAEQLRSDAWLGLGRTDSAAAACQRALSLAPPLASRWARLGEIHARGRRFDQTAACYGRAVELEPANASYLERLGRARIRLADYRAAALAFERCVRLAPNDAGFRRETMGAWQLAGDSARMSGCFRDGVRLGIAPGVLLGAETQGPAP